jgi:phosphate-selective porin
MSTVADYTPAPYDVKMVQGDTLRETFVFRDTDGSLLDLFGYTFASQVRATAAGSAVATFDITVDLNESKVVRTLGTAVTSGLLGRFVHDFQWTDPEDRVRTLIGGRFDVQAEVSRA